MPRIRTIKPEFWTSEKLATRLPGPEGRQARLLFIGLWNLAEDKTGVTRGNPAFLRGALFVYDDDVTARDVERWLALLEAGGFIVRYQRDGSSYVWVRKFLDHQKIEKPSRATLPEPSEAEKARSGDASPSPPRALPEPSPPEVVSSKGREEERKVEDTPQPPKGGDGGGQVPPSPRTVDNQTQRRQEPQPEALPFEAGAPHGSEAATWTLPDAVDAVHREVMDGRPYRWDPAADDKAATVLLSLCAADGIPIPQVPEEAARRFGRALVRSLWRFERATGKAVTLRELARRECWSINAEAPRRVTDRPDPLTGVMGKGEVVVEPWAAVLAKQEAA